MKIEKIKIDDKIIHNFFKTEFFIDTKYIRLCFNLSKFTCSVLIRELTAGVFDLYNNKFYDGSNENLVYLHRYFTNRQFEILKKNIKKAYMKILKIKYDEICGNDFVISDEHLKEFEKYRKIIDRI